MMKTPPSAKGSMEGSEPQALSPSQTPSDINALSKTTSPPTESAERSTSAQSGTTANAMKRRIHERLPIHDKIQLSCQDRQGVQHRTRARALNASKFGMLVESEEAVAPGTVAYLQNGNFTALGRASVRHCTQKGLRYQIGLFVPDRTV